MRVAVNNASTTRVVQTTRPRWRGVRLTIATTDIIALGTAYMSTYLLMSWLAPPAVVAPTWLLTLIAVLAVPSWLAIATAYGLYETDRARISPSSFDELKHVFHALLVACLSLLLVDEIIQRVSDWRIFGAGAAVNFVATALVLVPLARAAARTGLISRAGNRQRVLIVGTGDVARLLCEKLATSPGLGLDVVGFLDADSRSDDLPRPLLGDARDIARAVDEHEIDRVLIAFSLAGHEEILGLVRAIRRPDVQISIVPRYFEIFTSRATFDDVQGIPIVTLPPMRLGQSSRVLKRAFDVTASGFALLLLAPLLAAVALVVRLESPGPALYRQPRRGRNGGTFRIFKFRTMYAGAESRRDDVLHMNEVDGPLFKIKHGDPRVTRAGRFLRRASIDELPQLLNVLRGEMSLVGPRPFVLQEADQITGWASRRLDMTPGITGLWQVLGRNDVPYEEMVKLDYLYVTNWSLWWDIKILLKTLPAVFGRRGAY